MKRSGLTMSSSPLTLRVRCRVDQKTTAMPDSGPRQRVENPRNFFGNSRSVRQADVAPVPPQAAALSK